MEKPNDTDPKPIEPEEYRSFLKSVYGNFLDHEQTSAENFNQRLTLLATGALSLSLAFYNEVIPNPVSISLIFLGLSWVSIAASLGLNLIGHYHAVGTIHAAKEDLHNMIVGISSMYGDPKDVSQNPPAYFASKKCWLASLSLFLIGVALFVIFALYNVICISSNLLSNNYCYAKPHDSSTTSSAPSNAPADDTTIRPAEAKLSNQAHAPDTNAPASPEAQ